MTITDALRRSKETGESFSRSSPGGYSGWIRYWPEWKFDCLATEDIMADDWVTSKEHIETITHGKWTVAEPTRDEDLIDTLIEELRLQNQSHDENVARIRAEILTRFIELRGAKS
jgi:hypothetical protein